jgi:hypothetical protein
MSSPIIDDELQQMSRVRSKTFSMHDIDLLCRCYVAVSEDAVTGTDQSREALWMKIHQKFHAQNPAVEKNPEVPS